MRDEVKAGYRAGDYEEEHRQDRDIRDFERELLERLCARTPEARSILDLGCGAGLPFDKFFTDRGYEVKGIDLVEKHIEAARDNVPEANYEQADFTQVEFEEASFDAVISLYSIFHIPREEHPALLEKMYNWLKPSGLMLITLGAEAMARSKSSFAGSEMVWSSFGLQRNKEMVKEAGFEILQTYEEKEEEHHLWILAEKAKPRSMGKKKDYGQIEDEIERRSGWDFGPVNFEVEEADKSWS